MLTILILILYILIPISYILIPIPHILIPISCILILIPNTDSSTKVTGQTENVSGSMDSLDVKVTSKTKKQQWDPPS